jgi:hypothetical protein
MIQVYGSKLELLPLPAGKLKRLVGKRIPVGMARFITNTCRWGSFLVSSLSLKSQHGQATLAGN